MLGVRTKQVGGKWMKGRVWQQAGCLLGLAVSASWLEAEVSNGKDGSTWGGSCKWFMHAGGVSLTMCVGVHEN